MNAALAGAGAGFVSLIGSQPLEVMRARITKQLGRKNAELKAAGVTSPNLSGYSPLRPVLDDAMKTYKEEGAVAFLKQHPYIGFYKASKRMGAFCALFQMTREISKTMTAENFVVEAGVTKKGSTN